MHAQEIITYSVVFFALYVEVFMVVTLLANRKKIAFESTHAPLENHEAVTVIMPCWNESKTLAATVDSILALDYPRELLHVIMVDDGSTDNTWEMMQQYKHLQNVQIFKKENGGKHTAVNLGLLHTTTPFVGCLDADSFVDAQALNRIMAYFMRDPEVMAVAPAPIVHKPSRMIERAQRVEYELGVFFKKIFYFVNGVYVTPGPFSIFRKRVFDTLGPYERAHNTEDQEIALRMHKHHYKIAHCHDAYVYTVSPNTVKKLFRQRLRWIYGFLKNTIDYRELLFSKKYGSIGWFVLPTGIIGIFAAIAVFGLFIYNGVSVITETYVHARTVGLSFLVPKHLPSFDLFFINTQTVTFVAVILYMAFFVFLVYSQKLLRKKFSKIFSIDLLYFAVLSSFIAPFWFMQAIINVMRSKQSSWR